MKRASTVDESSGLEEPLLDSSTSAARVRQWLADLEFLDWLAVALLAAGGLAVATGLLPRASASASVSRIAPLLLFLAAVIVLAELAAGAELFDVIATRLTIVARGSTVVLFTLCVAFAAVTTMFLNLDTTAVLLTPVLLATATRAGVNRLALAMTTVWLANTASLLLPVSNLTNLLAANRVRLGPLAFAARMALPQVAALLVVAGCLWLFYWRTNDRRYAPPGPHRPADRVLFRGAAVACALFVAGVLLDLPIAAVSTVSAAVLAGVYLWRRRRDLRPGLIPWRLLVFVTGLFLVVDTIGRHGLSDWMSVLIGADPGRTGIVRAATTGGLLSNVFNNLPTYVAGEAVVPSGNHDQLLALLIGTNVGPLITPWASLATLLWAERCRAAGVTIRWGRFVLTGAVVATLVLVASVAALLV
ncbi:ArsB/NhaD family transporter [Longispora sp. K20-0274]|uniref:SLC13 family permease n=1 Tax=Longispora sp. K20-0274 TaxID=3088255 RepID=UPI0039999867